MIPRRKLVLRLELTRGQARSLLAFLAIALSASELGSETLSITTSYPSPWGVYTTLTTTGRSASGAVNTVLNRNAGNVLLVPPTNSSGKVGIGTATPAQKLDVEGAARISAGLALGGPLTLNGQPVRELAEPASAQDGATKAYVDAKVAELLALMNQTPTCQVVVCNAPQPACGQTTFGQDNCGGRCKKDGPPCRRLCGTCNVLVEENQGLGTPCVAVMRTLGPGAPGCTTSPTSDYSYDAPTCVGTYNHVWTGRRVSCTANNPPAN